MDLLLQQHISPSKRRTGRTRTMLRTAALDAKNGKSVIVVGSDRAHITVMMKMMCELEKKRYNSNNTSINFTTPHTIEVRNEPPVIINEYGRVEFKTINDKSNWSWPRLNFLYLGSDGIIYVDHYTIEAYIESLSKMFAELHRWDK